MDYEDDVYEICEDCFSENGESVGMVYSGIQEVDGEDMHIWVCPVCETWIT